MRSATKQPMAASRNGQSSSKGMSSALVPMKPQVPLGMTLPVPPKPTAAIGDVVKVVGRILKRHESKLVNLDSLSESAFKMNMWTC